jgi:hypothetical protein
VLGGLVRAAGVRLLGALPDAGSFDDHLIARVTDKQPAVRLAAAQALAPRAAEPKIWGLVEPCLADPGMQASVLALKLIALGQHTAAGRAAITWGLDERRAVVDRLRTAAHLAEAADLAQLSDDVIARLEECLFLDLGARPIASEPRAHLSRVAAWLGSRLPGASGLADRLQAQLRDDRVGRRITAGIALLAWPGGPPAEVLDQIFAALDNWRCLESYPARLTAASWLLNQDRWSQDAIRLCREAMEYGTRSWEWFDSPPTIRGKAISILGQLDPRHFDQQVFDDLLRAHRDDRSIRSSCYAALVRLAGVREMAATQRSS